jgi:hypothetical protein
MTSSRHVLLRAALGGAALGAAWGVLARAWMRLVSTSPEFSWAGSLAIVVLAAVFGAGVGLSSAARRSRGWRRWLRLAVVPGMILFVGQGLPLLPAFALAGPLLGRRNPLAKGVAALSVVGPGVLFWWTERLDETTMLSAPLHVRLGLLLGMPAISVALAWAGHLVWGPLPQRQGAPTRASVDGVGRARPQQPTERLQA